MTRRGFRTASLALLTVVPLALAACGGDDDDAGGSGDLVARVADKMMENADESQLTRDEAECAAGKAVALLGNDRTRDLLKTEGDADIESLLKPEEQEKFFTEVLSCLDVGDLMSQQLADSGMSEDQIDCLIDQIGEDKLADAIAASAGGTDPDGSEYFDAVIACGIGG